MGIGVDVVSVERFTATMNRTPGVGERVLTDAESQLPIASQAVRFAAKEALAKAIGKNVMAWHDVEVINEESGAPRFNFTDTARQTLNNRNINHVHLSLSHDGDMATAFVIAES